MTPQPFDRKDWHDHPSGGTPTHADGWNDQEGRIYQGIEDAVERALLGATEVFTLTSQAINDALAASPSGVIGLIAGSYDLSTRVVVGGRQLLIGRGNGRGAKTDPIPTRLVCSDAAAGLTFQGSGGRSGAFAVFADGVATNPVLVDISSALPGGAGSHRAFSDLYVDGAVEDNVLVYTPQNMNFHHIESVGAARHGIVFDKGTAGHTLDGECHFSSNGGAGIYVTESGHVLGQGATKPGQITMIGGIVELNGGPQLLVEYLGNPLRFHGTSFAVSAGAEPVIHIDEASPGQVGTPVFLHAITLFAVGAWAGPALIKVDSTDAGVTKIVITGGITGQWDPSIPLFDSPNCPIEVQGPIENATGGWSATPGTVVRQTSPGDVVAQGIVFSARNFATAPATVDLGTEDSYMGVDTAGGAATIRLPDLDELATQGKTGKIIEVKDETGHAHTNNITVSRFAGATGGNQLIDAAASHVIVADRGSVRLRALTNAWMVLGRSYFLADHVADLAAIYAMLKDVSTSLTTAAVAGTEYLVAPNQANLVVTATSAGGAPSAAAKRRLKAADYTPPSPLATKLKLACTVSPANGNPNATFTFALKPVSTTTGLLVVGAAVATVAITPSSGNADFENESADFAFPTDGEYVVTCTPSAIPAVSCGVSARIQRRAV